MRRKNTISWKYVVYLIIFMATALITFISMHYQAESAATMEMTEAQFPIVMVEGNNNVVYNPMHGINQQIDTPLMDTPLTPLPDNRELKIAIDTYGSVLKEISYKVRDTRDHTKCTCSS